MLSALSASASDETPTMLDLVNRLVFRQDHNGDIPHGKRLGQKGTDARAT